MAKIEAAQKRMFKNIFVCKDCGNKIRTDALRVNSGKVKCRSCGKKKFRPIKKK
jgi:predicted RNA-binding Zn-ribbon protein involved in translation (DUF1610 family)